MSIFFFYRQKKSLSSSHQYQLSFQDSSQWIETEKKKTNFIFLFVLLNTAMKEVGHALFLAIVLSIAREKASAEGNTTIERKEVKMSAFFRNINKGRRHYRIN